jgi:hypothetical protein
MVDQVIFDGETDNVLPANATVVHAEANFVVKVWSPTADYDSGTVTVYILADDDTAIALQTFTEDGAYFGRVGDEGERVTAGISGVAGASADISCTVSRSR